MSYAGVLEAVKQRLLGNRPAFKATYPTGLTPGVQGGISVRGVNVNVLYLDSAGYRAELGSVALTYSLVDMRPRFSEWIPPEHDPITEDVATSMEVIDTGIGPVLRAGAYERRPLPEPMDFMVEVRAYAGNEPMLLAALTKYVWRAFPPRSYIWVPLEDGTHDELDMLYEGFVKLPPGPPAENGESGVKREPGHVWTYNVEGYLDTTDQEVLVSKPRTIEIEVEDHEGGS